MAIQLLKMLSQTVKELLPLIALLLFFQLVILRTSIPNIKNVFFGVILAVLGLFIFIRGLQIGLFPLGESLGIQFARKGSLTWTLIFAFLLGYATTVAEPALIAVASKSEEISNGVIREWHLRNVVALGVAFGITYGVLRIVFDISLSVSLISGYFIVALLTYFAPSYIIGLAYDCGGVTTSTITVPLVAALGIGITSSIAGRDPFIDGFGLIAFATLFSIISVLLFGILVK